MTVKFPDYSPNKESIKILFTLLQRSNENVLEAMMRLTPFLTFGRDEAMTSLISHFLPFFDFER